MLLRLEVTVPAGRENHVVLRAVCPIECDEVIAEYEETHVANEALWKSWGSPGGAGYAKAEELTKRGHQVTLGKGFEHE